MPEDYKKMSKLDRIRMYLPLRRSGELSHEEYVRILYYPHQVSSAPFGDAFNDETNSNTEKIDTLALYGFERPHASRTDTPSARSQNRQEVSASTTRTARQYPSHSPAKFEQIARNMASG